MHCPHCRTCTPYLRANDRFALRPAVRCALCAVLRFVCTRVLPSLPQLRAAHCMHAKRKVQAEAKAAGSDRELILCPFPLRLSECTAVHSVHAC